MLEKKKLKSKPTNTKPSDDVEPDTSRSKHPPLSRHFKHTNGYNEPKYKFGDGQFWNGVTYYLCYQSNHK